MGFRRALRLVRAAEQLPELAASMEPAEDGVAFELNVPDDLRRLWGMTPGDWTAPVSEAQALSVPAIKRGRDLICGTLGGLPVRVHNAKRERIDSPLMDQPEPEFARSVTMTRTFQDMLFQERAWWRVIERDPKTLFPTKIRRLDARTVVVREDARVYVARDGNVQGGAMEPVPDRDLIRIESPNAGILRVGARAIRQALDLDKAAALATAEPAPQGVFTPREGVDPGDETEVQGMVDRWVARRKQSSWGYVGAALDLEAFGWNPEQLQLADQRQHAVLELARLMGVDPEDLGVSTTSRTYQNGEQRRLDLIDFTLAAYANAFQDRLSMNDVLPPGQVVRIPWSGFLRSDTLTRMQTYEIGRRVGVYDDNRIAELEDIPSATPTTPAGTPGSAPGAAPDPQRSGAVEPADRPELESA